MTSSKASESNPTDAALEMGWLLVAVLVPLAVNLWASQPFEPAKATLMRSLVWGMAALWLADGLLARRPLWREIRDNPLLWPVLAVAATQTLATMLSVDWKLSLWGSFERSQGLLTLLSYVILYLMASNRLRTMEQARRLATAMAATSAPLILLGLGQALGWNPANLVTDARSPVLATLGRSNFLGAYLAMLLPLILALTVTAGDRWKKVASGAWLLATVGVMGLTLARGAWLAGVVAATIFSLLWFWPRLAPRWRRLAVVGGVLGLGAGLAGMLWLGRQGGSAQARLTIWRAVLDLIARRPALGHGPDTLGLVFPRVYPPELVYYQGRGVTVDRAHNLFLDWTVTTGTLGLLAGLALLAGFFVAGWRGLQQARDNERRALLIASMAAIAGNVAGNMVGFDLTATSTASWLLMALLPVLGASPRARSQPIRTPTIEIKSPRAGAKRMNAPSWAAAILLLVGACAATWQANIRPLAAGMAALSADQRAAVGDWTGAIDARERAAALWPAEPSHRLSLSWAYLQQAGIHNRDPIPLLERAEAELLAARELRPADHRIWAALGELYGMWGTRWDAEKLPLSRDAYRQATALAPHHAMLYAGWGLVEMEAGNLLEAATKFRQAVDLDATDGYSFSHLGDVELAQGQVDRALDAYRQALHWEPGLSYAHLGLARCYSQMGLWAAARHAVDRTLQLDPGNAAALSLRAEMERAP